MRTLEAYLNMNAFGDKVNLFFFFKNSLRTNFGYIYLKSLKLPTFTSRYIEPPD